MGDNLVTGGLGTIGFPVVGEFESQCHRVCVANLPWSERDQYYPFDGADDRGMERISQDVEDTQETFTNTEDNLAPAEVHDERRYKYDV